MRKGKPDPEQPKQSSDGNPFYEYRRNPRDFNPRDIVGEFWKQYQRAMSKVNENKHKVDKDKMQQKVGE